MSSWLTKLISFSFLLLFILLPLVFNPNSSELFEFNKLIVMYFFTSFIVCLWLSRMLAERRIIFTKTSLDKPLLIFLLCVLCSVLFSIDKHMSFFGYYSRWNGGLLSLVCYCLLYWAYVSNMSSKSTLNAIRYTLVTACLVALWAILERGGHSLSCLFITGHFDVACWVQKVQDRPFASLGQPNWLASYLVALIFIPISKLFNVQASSHKSQSSTKSQKSNSNDNYWSLNYWTLKPSLWFGVWSLVLACMGLALLFTGSRSGFLALAISAAVYAGYRFHKKFFILVPIIILASSLYLIKLANQPLSTASGTESFRIRTIVWQGALASWTSSAKDFALGSGPETFTLAYYKHRPLEHNQTSEWELLYNKAHNEYLNYLTTTGLLGTAAYLYLLMIMFKQLKLAIRNSQLAIALVAGWISLLVTNFFGFSTVLSNVLLFLLPALAFSLNEQISNVPLNDKMAKWSKWLIAFPVLCFVLCVLWLVNYYRADLAFSLAHRYFDTFQSSPTADYLLASYESYLTSFSLNPNEPIIASEFSLSAAYSALALKETSATDSAQLASNAIQLSRIATTSSPNPNFYRTQAKVFTLLSDFDPQNLQLASQSLLIAQLLSPTDPRLPYQESLIQTLLGNASASSQFRDYALKLKPDLPATQ